MTRGLLALASLLAASMTLADSPGLLFRVSADASLEADRAAGDPVPNFQSQVEVVASGRSGGALRWQDDGYVAWRAPGNLYARRGTLSFFWRPREPLGEAPFVIFRAGYADHTSWDMAFLRIDWNGAGFDAFVTDTTLARRRVSYRVPRPPAADAWVHIALAWDEAIGISLYVDGREVARLDGPADLDAGLDQFGFAGRIIAPHQVQSRYNFMRGSDVDELRIYDRLLPPAQIARLAALMEPSDLPSPAEDDMRRAWLVRHGWSDTLPPVLAPGTTRIRKVEFGDARDLKAWMWKGVDGIAETTWPGVYNRSRLPGRNDYFELPDWNVYVDGGTAYRLTIPPDERFNRVEIQGAAFGELAYAKDGQSFRPIAERPPGVRRSVHEFPELKGGELRFTNVVQETPIQEIGAFEVSAGQEPAGTRKLSYSVRAGVAPDFAALRSLQEYIAGRFPVEERSVVVALPAVAAASRTAVGAGAAAVGTAAHRKGVSAPLVHVLIPSGFGDALPARPVTRAWNYGWENAHDGLDGIAIDLPPLHPGEGAVRSLIAIEIRVKDPIWPGRDMIDVSFAVRPGEPYTLWLDLRDRILTSDSLMLSVAASDPSFRAESLEGMNIRLVFKDRDAALKEHVMDRFSQVRDNWGFLVEEHTASKRAALYRRLLSDITDLLRVDPDNVEARRYWADISYGAMGYPPFRQPVAPKGVPLWAFRQLEDLKLVHRFVEWWIDERQVGFGDFGGGLSDDTDLTQQWPGLALMGVIPDKINASLRSLSDAVYANGMIENGLGSITTDELHAYEEGLNSDAERLYLNWGEPKAVERLMATTHALGTVIQRNSAGHVHFASNWYGARKVYREGPWEWQKPYSFSVMHGPVLLGVFSAQPLARTLVTDVVDGWLAHGRPDEHGGWAYPNEINWRTDAERKGDGGGQWLPLQSAWAAWRFTGDGKYLRPIMARVESKGPESLDDINENAVAVLGRAGDWGATLVRDARTGGEFAKFVAWSQSDAREWLEALHADAIESKSQRMYMQTEGHWWSDRVEVSSEILQRERLGGIAAWRNQIYPGNAVSWRFTEATAAEKIAILVHGATPDRFRVVAYNTDGRAQQAVMTAWNVTSGRWKLTTPDGKKRQVDLERSRSIDLTFAPHAETVLDFALVEKGIPTEERADIGIGSDDISVAGNQLTVAVHSLGRVPAPSGEARLVDPAGQVRARATIPALEAPIDLLPRIVALNLPMPPGVGRGWSVQISLPDSEPEVTMMNNVVVLPATVTARAVQR